MDRASAQNADAVAWARLFHEFAQGYDEELSDQAVRIVWSWPQDPGYDLHGLLALDLVGEVAGFAHYRPFPGRFLHLRVAMWTISLLTPAFRGQGASDALLLKLMSRAASSGWAVVCWTTAATNKHAIALYDGHAIRTNSLTYEATPSRGYSTAGKSMEAT